MVKDITTQEFDEKVIDSSKPVLVDFWASYCSPCKMLSPVIDNIARENPDIKVGKVNVEKEQELAGKFNVMSVPTLMVFKNGKKVSAMVGVQPKEKILEMF